MASQNRIRIVVDDKSEQDQNCSWWQVGAGSELLWMTSRSRIRIQSAFDVVAVILTRHPSEYLQLDTFTKHLLAMFVFWHYSAFPSWLTVRCLLRCWFPLCKLVGRAIVSFAPRPSLIVDQFSHWWRCMHSCTLISFSLWMWSTWNCVLAEKPRVGHCSYHVGIQGLGCTYTLVASPLIENPVPIR